MANPPNLEILVDRPSGPPIVRDYVAGVGAATGFFSGHFGDRAAYANKAAEVDGRFDRAARARAVEALTVPEAADRSRLERFVDQGGYMVTTGQQPALFGGPLYCVYKGLTAVRLAEALEAHLGKVVLPVFWVASDDHDWDEANHVEVVGVDNALHRVSLPAPDPEKRPSLHRIALPAEIERCVDEFLQLFPRTDYSEAYFALIRDSFRPGATIPAGFGTTLERLLGRFGLLFTDAADASLKAHSADLLTAELGRTEEMEGVLRGTGTALEAAGYDLQVPILEGGVNLFLEGPGGRERLYRDGTSFRLRGSGTLLSVADVLAAQRADPAVLSPNVLLRPVVESWVFPTLAYVGGPGEVAYFAQLGAYFAAHGVVMPVVHPRWSATTVEGKIRKVLDKFDVTVDDLQRPFHEIAGAMARDEVPEAVRSALGKVRGAVSAGVAELQEATRPVDPTLKGSVQHVRSQAFAALDDLERKIVAAVKRETDIALAQLEKAQVHLYPDGKPAERVQSPFYLLTRYGEAVLDALHERFAVKLA